MANFRGNVQDYATAEAFLAGKNERKLAHNTIVHRYSMSPEEGAIAVFYHRTPIVTYYPNGIVFLNTGGWETATTKERIRKLLPPGFYLDVRNSERGGRGGEWFIVDQRPGIPHEREISFARGRLVMDTRKLKTTPFSRSIYA
jgi:hypothetical protein